MGFIESQGIINMFNDDASTHPRRVAAFEGIKQIVYRVVDVEAFHYDELTKKKYVAMAQYLAKLHAAM